jgi:cytochrome c-type biogenesis protein CcmH
MTSPRLFAILGAVLCLAAVADPADRMGDPAKEARARSLFREIRCLVCQGESIDESDAPLADDLRKLVRSQIAQGASDGQVRAFLEARYGPFVLLRPRFSPTTAALWVSPFLAAAVGGCLLLFRRRRAVSVGELTPQEEQRLAALTHDAAD